MTFNGRKPSYDTNGSSPRHGHLMLYDDAEQIEVRCVISLAHHNVSIYSGGEKIPEGELWIKKNAICLTRKPETISGDLESPSSTMPFYFFSDRLSEKEDFYFAILRSIGSISDDSLGIRQSARPLHFDPDHIVHLTHRIHSSKEHLETNWLNALVGRWFLAVYHTPEFRSTIRKKIEKKISRMPKLPLLTDIVLKSIDPGDGAPMITSPRLMTLNSDGTTCIEFDLNYEGGFMICIASSARFDFGPRINAKEFPINLWVDVKKLSGHCVLHFKPPPSNRIWYAFTEVPQMDMVIKPVLGEKHVNINIAIRAIETKIREALAESVVLPFWDDIPFYNTENKEIRGGIWEYKEEPKRQKHAAPPARRSSCSDAPVLDTKRESISEKSSLDTADDSHVATPNASIATRPPMRKAPRDVPLESEKIHDIVDHPHTFTTTTSHETSGVAVDTAEAGGIFTSSTSRAPSKERRSSHTSHLSSRPSLSDISEKSMYPQNQELRHSSSKATLQNIFSEASNAISAKRRTLSTMNNDEKRRGSTDSVRSTTAESLSSDRTASSRKSTTGPVSQGLSVAKRWGMTVFGRKNRQPEKSASSISEVPQPDLPERKDDGSATSKSQPTEASRPVLPEHATDEIPSLTSHTPRRGKTLSAPAPAPVLDKASSGTDEPASVDKPMSSLLSAPAPPRPKSMPGRKPVPPPFVPTLPPRSKSSYSETHVPQSISEKQQPEKPRLTPPPLPTRISLPSQSKPPLPARLPSRYMSSETDSTFTTSQAKSETETSVPARVSDHDETALVSPSPSYLASASDSSLLVMAEPGADETQGDAVKAREDPDETSFPDMADALTPNPNTLTLTDSEQHGQNEKTPVCDTEIVKATVANPMTSEKSGMVQGNSEAEAEAESGSKEEERKQEDSISSR